MIRAFVRETLICATDDFRRMRRDYDFYIAEMMFMTSDSYRLPLKDKLRAAILCLRSNPKI
ncbi:MAG: hypothetical protein DI537_43970 [Stutzerimonas stutzeri]|nr:MAG: hypothetical protein DI537_43970 [Stutzerimonas stutzeri]